MTPYCEYCGEETFFVENYTYYGTDDSYYECINPKCPSNQPEEEEP